MDTTIQSHGDDHAAAKRTRRTEVRAARRERCGGTDGAARREEEGRAILAHASDLLAQVEERLTSGPAVVSLFHPMPTEPDTLPLARALRALGDVTVLFPAASGGDALDWIAWDGDEDFAASSGRGFGAEPTGERRGADALSVADLILAPALAVDRSGTRLGHGGGYYDRALPHRRPGTQVIAIVHPWELLDAGALPRDAHDVPVDGVLTAAGLVDLRG